MWIKNDKLISEDRYYFSAANSTNDNVILIGHRIVLFYNTISYPTPYIEKEVIANVNKWLHLVYVIDLT